MDVEKDSATTVVAAAGLYGTRAFVLPMGASEHEGGRWSYERLPTCSGSACLHGFVSSANRAGTIVATYAGRASGLNFWLYAMSMAGQEM